MIQNHVANVIDFEDFVSKQANQFFQQRIHVLEYLTLPQIISGNPYLLTFSGHRLFDASCLIEMWLGTTLLANDTLLFDKFLENTAILLFTHLFQWRKLSQTEQVIALETPKNLQVAYVKARVNSVAPLSTRDSIESLQIQARQLENTSNKLVHPILGICWGPDETVNLQDLRIISGRSFWSLIANGTRLFDEILATFSSSTLKHSEIYEYKKAATLNKLTREFIERFCNADGAIDWLRLVEFNSGNLDLHEFIWPT